MLCVVDGVLRCNANLSGLLSGGHHSLAFCILTLDEIELIQIDELIKRIIANGLKSGTYTKYERNDACDLIYLRIPPSITESETEKAICLAVTNNLLLVVYREMGPEPELQAFLGARLKHSPTPVRLLLDLLEWYTRDDTQILQTIEEDVTNLEDALISSTMADHKNSIHAIITFRKKLLSLKRYYEQLMDVLFALAENDGNLLGKSEIKYAKNMAGRAGRLHQTVTNLRDYVTQVREAYQSQVDISLNQTMKVFTVITAIFLPLTLIVGWYGMNFNMPEYGWKYAYPIVIACSAIVVVTSIILFKWKKWF